VFLNIINCEVNMNIIILGASGFLGGKVYEKLILENNHEVLGTCFIIQ